MKKFLLTLVLFAFCAISFAQSITLTSPNGGQVWAGCTQQTITWNAAGVSNFYTIDYSLDAGASWISITSSLNITNGTYTWTVPNINSNQTRIRVMDSSSPSTFDVSDNNFTITGPLILTSPIGGESWQAGTIQPITWAASGTSGVYLLEYSINAGSSWTTIINNHTNSTGFYNWTVPNFPSAACQVRITDVNNGCMTYKSPNLFTITPPTPVIILNSPNGGQTWYVGNSYNISWSGQNLSSSNVAIDYSINNGASWLPVATSTPNDGSQPWTVPGTVSNLCLIRVSELGSPSVFDISNAVFTIANPFIQVLAPNGGENLFGCSNTTISWTSGGLSGSVFSIQYSSDNGQNWNAITTTSGSSYTWSVPNIASNQGKIRIINTLNTSVGDTSNNTFNFIPNTEIIVTSPNGTEQWDVGSSRQITWVKASGIGTCYLSYSINGGNSWSNITSSSSTSYNWTVPNNIGQNVMVRVEDVSNSCKNDVSDTVFGIIPPIPIILVNSPNTNQTRYVGSTASISWSAQYLTSSFVTIQYSIDNGTTWLPVVSPIANSGSYSWVTPNTPSTQCLVKVSEYGNPSVFDISNVNFTIATPFISLITPNGGNTFNACTNQSIFYNAGGINSYYLYYSVDNGQNWNFIVNTSLSSYAWAVPNSGTNQAKILITDPSGTYRDSSDLAFTIVPNTDIIITSPNGGEQWDVGSTRQINWVKASGIGSCFIEYSTTGGNSWSTITSSSSTQISWTIPNNLSNNALIRVYEISNSCKTDQSDSSFSIVSPIPYITVNSPNTNQTRYVGSNSSISWSSQYLTSPFVTIQYSFDNGATWIPVASPVANNGSYSWLTPNTPSNQCLVKVSEYGNPNLFDVSNVNFTIATPFVSLNSLNGGEVIASCESRTINFSSGGLSSFILYYSTDNGSTWNGISSTSSSSISWNVPNEVTTQAKILVTDASGIYRDSSDATFSILANNDIIVTSPNGSEQWDVGSSRQITWVKASGIGNCEINYSVNGGASWLPINTISTTSINWTIPNNVSNNVKVRVRESNNNCKSDVSDANFAIIPGIPFININSPNTALTRYVGANTTISWSSAYINSSFVSIDYSINNGSTWISLTNATNNTGSYSWTIPNTPSTQCLVRVSEFNNPTMFDVSDVPFTIAYPSITIISPNGGQQFPACSTSVISFNNSGFSSTNYSIYSSIDNGITWDYLGNSNSSSFNWTVPNVGSNQYKIKVTASQGGLNYEDQSDNTFTVIPNTDIIVLQPNGGEQWDVGSSRQINWVKASGIGNCDIQYSINGGNSWTQITTISSTAYNWTVPNNVTSSARIRVQESNNTCKSDASDNNFSIIQPTPIITVTSPNTSLTRYIGSSSSISWSSAYLSSNFVKIELSIDNGTTWSDVISATPNNGTYSWTVPNTISTQCLVRVSEYGNPSVSDVSNVPFTIATPFISVVSPNGGEILQACNNTSVFFSSGGFTGSFVLDYSTDGGATWNTVSSGINSGYAWSVPNTASNNVKIRVSQGTYSDISDNSFTILGNQDIILTSPNGGEQWDIGSPRQITWVKASGIGNCEIYYSTNGGNSWNYIIQTSGTSYNWTIPSALSNNARIRIQESSNPCKNDMSNASFSIIPAIPYLNVTSPNTSVTRYIGSNTVINWNSGYLTSPFVTIDFSTNNGLSWTNIVQATNNNGSYSWLVPNTPSSQCLVRVSEYNNPFMFDVSDVPFTIAPSITIITPNSDNGVEEWRVCTQTTISWTSGGVSGSYNIDYSINGGASWIGIVSNYVSSGSNNSYTWNIPNNFTSSAKVRVTDASSSTRSDESDATFTILPAITFNSPNAGDVLYSGTVHTISWQTDGASNTVNIDYSLNGGSTWTNIVFNQNIPSKTYAWTVPAIASTNAVIRITDNINNCKLRTSGTFTIASGSPAITLTSPNGGGTWNSCGTENITWNATGTSGIYLIQYSTNAGQNWTTITNNFSSGTNSYAWNVPNLSSSQMLIKVSDANALSKTDQSDMVFTINAATAPTISVSGPTTFCLGGSVTLTSSSTTGNTWSPGATSNQSINVTGSGTYSVTVNSGACSITSLPVTVTVNPIPTTPSASSNSPVIYNNTLQLFVGTINGATYSWSGPNNFSSNVQNPSIANATPSLNGNYTVTATVNGCTSSAGSVVVTVQPNNTLMNISGMIKSENGNAIRNASIDVSGTASQNMTTGTNGLYDFTLNQGGNYTLTPSKSNDVNITNGITTLDILLIQQHILGSQSLATPYKIIAADVNKSNSISTLDILLIRSLILGNISTFPNGQLWSFVDAGHTFSNPQNPFPYPSSRNYVNASGATNQDFFGMKLGDVDNSWNSNINRPEIAGTILFETENQTVNTGSEILVPVRVKNFDAVKGYQFTINWDASVLEFVQAQNSSIDGHFGENFISEGKLITTWYNSQNESSSLDNGTEIFVLKFKVIGAQGSVSPIEISSDLAKAEAYNKDLQYLEVSGVSSLIQVGTSTGISTSNNFGYQLLPNEPNPFSLGTYIVFETPANAEVELTITDALGRIIRQTKGKYEAGHHKLYWESPHQNQSEGIYFIHMKAGNYSETRKMVKVK